MAEMKFKRNVAYKFRIGDLLIGKPIFDGERFSFLELGDKRIVRANLIGNIIDKFESDGEKRYVFYTIDDGSGQIGVRVFGDDVESFKDYSQGQTILVIGVLRYFNGVYVLPEIMKELDPRFLLIRKLEIEKTKNESFGPVTKEKIMAIKDRILGFIRDSEENGGVDLEELMMKITDTSPEMINQEIKRLLEEGIIFEPRPGRVRYLG